ncbi:MULTISPECIES: hypothetical protein [Paenibacillus]|uniref:tetratricopeptide repeat protein n=1 Tax=Paenibacillus TaxID=44249 RepID=UPI000FDC1CC4|nr:hypothetical protein [Paenibacillus amylolyticus]
MELANDYIEKLLEEKKFEELEKYLKKMKKENYNDSSVNYYLGVLYSDYNNPKKSEETAKSYFLDVISSNHVYEYAYIYLEQIERNRNKSIRILEAGLKCFPNSLTLNKRLLYNLDNVEKENLYQKLLTAEISSNDIHVCMMNYYYSSDNFSVAIDTSKKINRQDEMDEIFIILHNAYCFYHMGEIDAASKRFVSVVDIDLKHTLNYAPHIGLILCHLSEKNHESAFEIFAEIPNDYEIDVDIMLYPDYFLNFEEEFNDALHKLENINIDKLVLAKIRGLRGLSRSNNDNNKTEEKKVIRDLEFARKNLKNNLTYIQKLKQFAEYSNRNFDAFKFGTYTIAHGYEKYKEEIEYEYYWSFIDKSTEEEVLNMKDELLYAVEIADNYKKKYFSGKVLTKLIRKIFKFALYKDITDIAEKMGYKEINKYILFEIAYSYYEANEFELSQQFYERHEEENGKNSATSNNMGIILKKKGLFSEAKDKFRLALELDPDNRTASKNYDNISEIIVEREQEQKLSRKIAQKFAKENAWIKGKLLSFSKFQDSDGFIVCSYKKLPQFLNASEVKANELLNNFIGNKYILKVNDHNINTTSSVYRINSDVLLIINELEKNEEHESVLIELAENITLERFLDLGYDKKLLSSLDKVSNPDLKGMLERDINENVLSLITKSFKSSLILSGSIIEAVLLDHISSKNITQYTMENGRNKRVNQMDLNELLYVSNQENFIDIQLYYLSHAIRGFRNLIHPGVEQRKRSVIVNEENAMLAWSIVKKVIQEI